MFKKRMIFSALISTAAVFTAVGETETGFVPLFDGKSLAGWQQHGTGGNFAAVDGEIRATPKQDDQSGAFLGTEREYENFIFRCEFKFDAFGNSGIQFRSQVLQRKNGGTSMGGYQFEMTPDGQNIARIFDQGRSAFKHRNTKAFIWFDFNTPTERQLSARQSFFERGSNEWQQVEIRCEGPRIRTWLNGLPVVDLLDATELKGRFGLQFHPGKIGGVRWRNLRIRELPATKGTWRALDPANPGVHGDCIVRGTLKGGMKRPSMHWFSKGAGPVEMAWDEALLWVVPETEKDNVIESIYLGARAVHRVNMMEVYDLCRPAHAARAPLVLRSWLAASPADAQWEILDL